MSPAAFTHDTPGTPAAIWRADPRWADLPAVDAEAVLTDVRRMVVVAAHPDDETLGAGGLLAAAGERGLDVTVLLLTGGEFSHPHSPTWTPTRLAQVRREESRTALGMLAPRAELVTLDLGDGGLSAREDDVLDAIVRVVGDGRDTLLLAPWRHDGHPDHDATGRAAATAAVRCGARLLEHPIWLWHRAAPDQAPWPDLRPVRLTATQHERKLTAVRAHRTQVEPLSPAPGDEVLLGPDILEHLTGPIEVHVEQAVADTALDDLHQEHADPWGVDRRWYERRKRALLLAALPRERFGRALEVGCSTGALSQALADRCDRLTAMDAAPTAVAAARDRLADLDHVTVVLGPAPDAWPSEAFDLVVLSEVGYFLSPAAADGVIDRLRAGLTDDGVVVLCHWRHEVRGHPLDGAAFTDRVVGAGVRPVVARYTDRDVDLVVLARPGDLPEPGAG